MLHPRVLKEFSTELGPIFTHLFQQSIDSGDIPKEWTLANISPLFKKGDRSLGKRMIKRKWKVYSHFLPWFLVAANTYWTMNRDG